MIGRIAGGGVSVASLVVLLLTLAVAGPSAAQITDYGELTGVATLGQELFAGSATNQVLELRGADLVPVTECSNRPADTDAAVQRIVVDSADTVWAVTRSGVLWRSPAAHCWHFAAISPDHQHGQPRLVDGVLVVTHGSRDFAVRAAGAELVTAGADPIDNAVIRPIVTIDIPAEQGSRAVATDLARAAGGAYVATNRGIWFYDSPAPLLTDQPQRVAEGDYRVVAVTGDGIVAAGASGLVRIAGGLEGSRADLPFDSVIRDIAIDEEGTIWFGTGDGLRRISPAFVETDAAMEPSPACAAEDVSQSVEDLWRPSLTATTATGCFALVPGARGSSMGVLNVQSGTWALLAPATHPRISGIAADPTRPELLWIAAPTGLLLLDTQVSRQCVADFSSDCEQPCRGPADGCSAFTAADGLASTTIDDIGISADGTSLLVRAGNQTMRHVASDAAPTQFPPLVNVDGSPCADCLTAPVRWDAERVSLTPQSSDLGDWIGTGHQVFVNGERVESGTDGQFTFAVDQGNSYAVEIIAVDRHHNTSKAWSQTIEVAATPLANRLAHPAVAVPAAIVALVGFYLWWRTADLKSVEVINVEVRPDEHSNDIAVQISTERSLWARRPARSWNASIPLSASAVDGPQSKLNDFFDAVKTHQASINAAPTSATADPSVPYPKLAAHAAGLALADLIDPHGWLAGVATRKPDVTTRLVVRVAANPEHNEGLWQLHMLPWERLAAPARPAGPSTEPTYLVDHGLVVVMLTESDDTAEPDRPKTDRKELRALIAQAPDLELAAALAPREYRELLNSENVDVLQATGPAAFERELASGHGSRTKTTGWDVVRVHAHGLPHKIQLGDGLVDPDSWSAVKTTPPTLWLMMACHAGVPATIGRRTLGSPRGAQTFAPARSGLARRIAAEGLGRYVVGFDTEASIASIAAFEPLLLKQLGNGRQLDVAIRTARKEMTNQEERFALRVYATDPSLLLFNRR